MACLAFHPCTLALHRETPICGIEATAPARADKKIKLYQVGVLIRVFWPPILIQLQQNTFE